MYLMSEYDAMLTRIMDRGTFRTNQRTGIKTKSIFGAQTRYQLDTEFFPIVTRREMFPDSVFAELLWFLSGSTNNKDLKEKGCNFWTPWVDPAFESKNGYAPGSFGPVYGFQLRHFGGYYGNGQGGSPWSDKKYITEECLHDDDYDNLNSDLLDAMKDGGNGYGAGGFDQLTHVINRIKEDYSCRRTLWTLWNPHDVSKMRLPPCHMMFQLFVDDEKRLTGLLYQRSADYPVGVPANIQFYSALIKMIAQQTNTTAYEFVHTTGDTHIYEDQFEAVGKYLETAVPDSPKLTITPAASIEEYSLQNFQITDYTPGPRIKIPVAV